MKDQSKLQLSPLEMDLVNNAEWILTKNGILQKARQLLLMLQEKQQLHLQSQNLPAQILKPSPKISKGENYQGLPYLILDFPRFFEHKDIFAIRTMFWWGNFFSITMHLSGNYKIMYTQRIISFYEVLKETNFFICVHEEQWQHHFENDNYVQISKWNKDDFEYIINAGSFIKLANKIPVKQWDNAQETLLQYFKQMIEVLTV